MFRVGAPFAVRAEGMALDSLLGHRLFTPARNPQDGEPVFNGRIPNLIGLPPAARTVDIVLLTLPYIPTGAPPHRAIPSNLSLMVWQQGAAEEAQVP